MLKRTLIQVFKKPHTNTLALFLTALVFLIIPTIAQTASALTYQELYNYYQSQTQGKVLGASTTGLVGYWNFDEGSGTTAADSSGNGKNGTVSNVTWTSGQLHGALSFNGSNSGVDTGTGTSMNFGSTGGTWSFWVNPSATNIGQGYSPVMIERVGAGNYGEELWQIFWQPKYWGDSTIERTLQFCYKHSYVDHCVISSYKLTVDIWSHITVSYDGSNVYFYANGNLVDTKSLPNANFPTDFTLERTFIGEGDSGSNYFSGLIDEVRIYNRALSTQEVLGIFNDTGSATPLPPTDTAAPSVPANLSASAVSSSQINLSWTASTDNTAVAGYRIYQNGSQLTTTSNTSYSDSGLIPNTLYSYTVSAYDAAGNNSSQSTSASATTQTSTLPSPSGTVAPITIKSMTGSTQTSRPTSVFMTFKQGDIPHYPQAVISSAAIITQADVKTRWPDGSVKQAMVSFVYTVPASSNLTVAFQDQATGNNTGYLSKADLLARSWDAKIQTVASGITKSADARTILNAVPSISTVPDSLGVRYWLRGPVVTQVIMEDGSSSRMNDFGYTCLTNCTTGIQSTSQISTVNGNFTAIGHTLQNGALVKMHIFGQLGYVPGGFTNDNNYYVVNRTANTFQLSATNGGSAIVPTNVGSLPDELFWPLEIGGEVTGSASWASDPTYRSLHPIFVLTFFTGYSGVKVDYILTNDWTTALQDQRYALTLFGDSGNATTELATPEFVQYALSRWRYTYWNGTALGDVKIDHGFSYLTSTGIVPNYDPAGTVTAAQIAADVTAWNATDKCDPTISGHGFYLKGWGTTGQTTDDDIGLISAWEARWLYGMGNAAVTTAQFNGPTLGSVQCSANVPIHLRESDSSRWYDSGHTINAQGLPISADARPSIDLLQNNLTL